MRRNVRMRYFAHKYNVSVFVQFQNPLVFHTAHQNEFPCRMIPCHLRYRVHIEPGIQGAEVSDRLHGTAH